MENKLKNCPFCGSAFINYSGYGYMECLHCKATGSIADVFSGQSDDDIYQEAAKLWNTRPTEDDRGLWISTKDRLPEPGIEVFAIVDGELFIDLIRKNKEDQEGWTPEAFRNSFDYWMYPLALPKKGEEH